MYLSGVGYKGSDVPTTKSTSDVGRIIQRDKPSRDSRPLHDLQGNRIQQFILPRVDIAGHSPAQQLIDANRSKHLSLRILLRIGSIDPLNISSVDQKVRTCNLRSQGSDGGCRLPRLKPSENNHLSRTDVMGQLREHRRNFWNCNTAQCQSEELRVSPCYAYPQKVAGRFVCA